jgi:hypothetical protein
MTGLEQIFEQMIAFMTINFSFCQLSVSYPLTKGDTVFFACDAQCIISFSYSEL